MTRFALVCRWLLLMAAMSIFSGCAACVDGNAAPEIRHQFKKPATVVQLVWEFQTA
jgi:hypothetical protein